MKHKHCDVIKAWADGATVQYKNRASDTWADWKSKLCPGFDTDVDYRVKPPKREVWVRPHLSHCIAQVMVVLVVQRSSKELIDNLTDFHWVGPAVLVWKES